VQRDVVSRRWQHVWERLVGRERELALLDDLCASTAAGHGAVVVVSGAPGIGKSRLCAELARRAASAGLVVAESTCLVDAGLPGVWSWVSVVDTFGSGAEVTPLLAEPASDAAEDRFARFARVAEVLDSSCRRAPGCVVVDDLHEADVGTLLLTRFLARSLRSAPLLIVLARRTGSPRRAPPPGPCSTRSRPTPPRSVSPAWAGPRLASCSPTTEWMASTTACWTPFTG
jgi:hypothetical protein